MFKRLNHKSRILIIKISTISKQYIYDNLDNLLSLEDNWTEIGEKPWKDDNFLKDLPMKWELSFVAEFDKRPVGYIFGAIVDKNNAKVAKVTKLLVDKNCRSIGIGNLLLEKFEKTTIEHGIHLIEFKALIENTNANKFHVSHKYEKIGEVVGDDDKIRNHYRKSL